MPGPKLSPPNLLIVEGVNDREFVYHLTNHVDIPHGAYEIHRWEKNIGGFQTVVNSLPGFLVGSDVQRLGIVVDADEHPAHHWTSVVNKLRDFGYNLPSRPVRGGVVHSEPGKRILVGLWLMPDNESTGMLENLAAALIVPGDPLWGRAVDAVTRIPDSERRFKPTYEAKAHMHTWLAWQDEPGTQLGLAFDRHYLDAAAPPAVDFVQWLKRLFALP